MQQHLKNLFIQNWNKQLATINNRKIKNLYKSIKYDFIYEPYLELPYHLRNPLTKLRISNHPLRIETGRFTLPPLSIDDRKCFICEDMVEDELHFLFNCDYYHELDKYKDMLYYFGCIYYSFKDLTDIEKWIFIFNSKDLQAIKLYFYQDLLGKHSKLEIFI